MERPLTDIEANKALARAFFDLFNASDWVGLGDLLAPDFRWSAIASQRRHSEAVAAAPTLNSSPGYTRSETLDVFRATKENCVDGRFDITVIALTAEGDRVAVEAEAHAVNRANGRVYDNRYHHLMAIRDGLVHELREYQDTLLVFDVWMAP